VLGTEANRAGPAQPFVRRDDKVWVWSRLDVFPCQRDHDEYLAGGRAVPRV
jgi:hypothetical protein